jgi:hypothetical protein
VCDECGASAACLVSHQRDILVHFETGPFHRSCTNILILRETQTCVASVTFFHNIIFFQFICPVCLCTVTSYIIVQFIFCCHSYTYRSQWSVWKCFHPEYLWFFCVSCLDLWLIVVSQFSAGLKYISVFLNSYEDVEFEIHF